MVYVAGMASSYGARGLGSFCNAEIVCWVAFVGAGHACDRCLATLSYRADTPPKAAALLCVTDDIVADRVAHVAGMASSYGGRGIGGFVVVWWSMSQAWPALTRRVSLVVLAVA